jgi:rhamnosyltransferase
MRYGIIVPTLNAGSAWAEWIAALQSQSIQPAAVMILDSQSTDTTVEQSREAGFSIKTIERSAFNHGGTRDLGLRHFVGEVDALVCMTQDAILAAPNALENLLAAFDDPEVGAAYGRQLPSREANLLATHARLFNYPGEMRTVRLKDRAELGFRSCFLSNSFAAYRVSDLIAAGGFPTCVILGEDTAVAARMLLNGKAICYRADASVYHSHNYTIAEEFRRYFDTGVFHARSPWLLDSFGGASGEGRRFVVSEIRYLLETAPWLLPEAALRTLMKLAGYRLGRIESILPLPLKRRLSMFRSYWTSTSPKRRSVG